MEGKLLQCFILFSLLQVGCGGSDDLGEGKTASSGGAKRQMQDPNDTLDGSTTIAKAKNSEPIEFRGYVGGAFPITVDNERYEDSEDFFTLEASRLSSKIQAAGYDASWNGRFEAALGFNDLRSSMVVYIAPMDKKGFQAEGTVGEAGAFNITLPAEAADSLYKIRAVKRIHILLTKDSEHMKICYNFSAVEKSVKFSELDKPIILENFATKLTTYQCAEKTNSGVNLPKVESVIVEDGKIFQKISKGDLKSKVLEKWGEAAFVELPSSTNSVPKANGSDVSSQNAAGLVKWYFSRPFINPLVENSTSQIANNIPHSVLGSANSNNSSSSNVYSAKFCVLIFRDAKLESFSRECSVKFIKVDTF